MRAQHGNKAMINKIRMINKNRHFSNIVTRTSPVTFCWVIILLIIVSNIPSSLLGQHLSGEKFPGNAAEQIRTPATFSPFTPGIRNALRGTGILESLAATTGSGNPAALLSDNITIPGQPISQMPPGLSESWSRLYGAGTAASNAHWTGIADDNAGNIYLAGISDSIGQSSDVLLAAYTPAGALLWMRRYNGPDNRADLAVDIAVAGENGIYISGTSTAADGYDNMVLLRYDFSGALLWQRQYASPGNDNIATGLTVDPAGNIITCGYRYNAESQDDLVLLKYDPQGNLLWDKIFDGGEQRQDRPLMVRSDNAGNIIVSGFIESLGSREDFLTVKWSPDGTLLWKRRFDAGYSLRNIPTDMLVDAQGNIFISGFALTQFTAVDFSIVQYNAAGDQNWSSEFNGIASGDDVPVSIKRDSAGNLLVAGYSLATANAFEAVVIKFSFPGTIVSDVQYFGQPGQSVFATRMLIDDQNTLTLASLVPGDINTTELLLVKIDAAGNEIWRHYAGAASGDSYYAANVLATGDGRLQVAGGLLTPFRGDDAFLLEIGLSGTLNWRRNYLGAANSRDRLTAITHDEAGNIFLCGFSEHQFQHQNFRILKINPAGEIAWAANYNGAAGLGDVPSDIALGAGDHLYILGTTETPAGNDLILLKLNSAGEQLWASQFNSRYGMDDTAGSLAVDATGEAIYISGYSRSPNGIGDYLLLRIDDNGQEIWRRRYDGPARAIDQPVSLLADSDGSVIISGYSNGGAGGFDYHTLKYDADGELRWERRYNGSGNYWDLISDAAIDAAGAIYLTGFSYGEQLNKDVLTIKYDAGGNEVWQARFNGSDNMDDHAAAIVLDDQQQVYIAGVSHRASSRDDFLTLKYDNDGQLLWQALYDGPDSDWDAARALQVGPRGNLFVTGWSFNAGGYSDYSTVKYDRDGSLLWSVQSAQQQFADQEALDLLVQDNRITVAGNRLGIGTDNDWSMIHLLQYSESLVGTHGNGKPSVQTAPRVSNYPNPFNPTTNIRYHLPAGKAGISDIRFIKLIIYDVLGKKVKTLVNQKQKPGSYQIPWEGRNDAGQQVASGVYYYRLQAGNQQAAGKMLLVR